MCREITAKNVQKQWSKFNLRPKRLRQPRARCIPDAAHAPTRITDHAHPTRTHTHTYAHAGTDDPQTAKEQTEKSRGSGRKMHAAHGAAKARATGARSQAGRRTPGGRPGGGHAPGAAGWLAPQGSTSAGTL